MRVGLSALIVLTLCAHAHADDDKPADERAVGLVVQGGGSLNAKVADHLAKRLRREGYSAVDDPLSKGALDTIANCFIIEDLVCARGVVEARATTPRLIFARIDDTSGAVVFDFTWFSAGRAPVVAKQSCSTCGSTWQGHTDDLMGTLLAGAEMPMVIEDPADAPLPVAPRSRFWPTLLIGVGAATLVTGGTLVYFGLRDGVEHKYVYPQLTPAGFALIAIGGGAMIGGMITW
jgi:hypothetical protein